MKKAFTMAEILLSLTIIGVVAAITLPSLTGNINERTWNTQRKALYARFSQALALMPALNGYGTLTEESASDANDGVDTAAETFITDGLAKVMKINNICDNEHLEDCGIPTKINTMHGSVLSDFTTSYGTLLDFNNTFSVALSEYNISHSQINTKAAAFETANGENILVYYNPNCQGNTEYTSFHFTQPKMCANFIYDLNGSKGPNTVGKDIGFISALYATDPVIVAPMPLPNNFGRANKEYLGGVCQENDSDSRLPNSDELAAMFYNRILIDITTDYYWSSTRVLNDAQARWRQSFDNGLRYPMPGAVAYLVHCIRR